MPEGERFVCVAGTQPMDAAVPEARRDAPDGTIIETCPGAAAAVYEVAGRLIEQGGVKVNNEKASAANAEIIVDGEGTLLQVGKRKFLKVVGE